MVKTDKKYDEYKYPALMIGGSIIIVILIITLIGVPLWKDLQKNTAAAKTAKDEYEYLTEKLTNLKGLADKAEELKTKNAKVLAALPEGKDVSRLFVQFENIANQSGLEVKSVSEDSQTAVAIDPNTAAGTGQQEATGVITPVTYKVTGNAANYLALKNALTNFERALRIVSIDSFEVSNSTNDFGVIFTVKTYKRGQNE